MNKVEIPDSLSVAGWNAVKKADIGKDKALPSKVQAETHQARPSAVRALDTAYAGKFDFGARRSPRGSTAAAAAETALAKFDDGRQGAP